LILNCGSSIVRPMTSDFCGGFKKRHESNFITDPEYHLAK